MSSAIQPVPRVSVCMITYNHEPYIAQAIESVLMQKTDFPVELVIGEDGSTDGTREKCIDYATKYPDRIRLCLRERSDPDRQTFRTPAGYNFLKTLTACCGEYIALLEGDDYWTDPEKLSIQLRLLENHPETVLCSHRYRVLLDGSNIPTDDTLDRVLQGRTHLRVNYQNFLRPYVFQTLSVVFRRSALQGLSHKSIEFDTTLWAHLLSHGGEGILLNSNMGVYRKHAGGIWSLLPGKKRNELSFLIHCMLVSNEGFRSQCVKEEFYRVASIFSKDLIDEAMENLSTWKSHASKVVDITAQQGTATPFRRFGYCVICFLCRVQARLLRLQVELFKSFFSGGRMNVGGSIRLLLLVIWSFAASPVLILETIWRFIRRTRR